MKTLLKLFIFFLLTLGTLTNCSKYGNDNTPPYTQRCPQDLLDYCYFKKGTYWVYKDSATGITDSQYVTSDSLRMVPVYNNPTDMKHLGDAEKFDVEVFSPLEQYYYHYYFKGNDVHDCIQYRGNKSYPCNYVYKSKYHPNNYVGEDAFFSNEYYNGNSYVFCSDGSKNYNVKITNIYDSLIMNNIVYHNVYVLEAEKDELNSYLKTKYFIARHYGTIKKVTYATKVQTQTLIRFKIKQ